MKRLFADTGYWIAILNKDDDLHPKAILVSTSLGQAEIVTSQLVLAEFLNHFCEAGPVWRMMAQAVVGDILGANDVQLVPMTSELFGRTLQHYGKFQDKGWSFIDGSSILIMQDMGITEALTHDHHFEQAGFRALLR